VATQDGSHKENGHIGRPGPSLPRSEIVVTVSGGLLPVHNQPLDHSSDFGRCACGLRLYRKHRIASSLLNLINQAQNTSMPLSERKLTIGGSLNISCRTCGNTLEVGFAVSRPTTGRQASMSIALSMHQRMIASTSSGAGANRVQTMMNLLTDDETDGNMAA